MTASTEDPTPYTMELISREQLLGPHHPEVKAIRITVIVASAFGSAHHHNAPVGPTLVIVRTHLQEGGMQVAISLSNLAILHNQRGEYSKAQPLYERALQIFELNFGPSDANVAHTLTDLAVLHLEQVRILLLQFWLCTRGRTTGHES